MDRSDENLRTHSELTIKTPKIQSKRYKIDTGKTVENLTNKEALNSALVKKISPFQKRASPSIKLVGLARNFQNNLTLIKEEPKNFREEASGRPGKSRNHQHNLFLQTGFQKSVSKGLIKTSPKVKRDLTLLDAARPKLIAYQDNNIRKTPKHNEDKLNIAFVEEKQEFSKIRLGERERKQRRLSGIFKTDLNTGFIEEHPLNDEDNAPNEEYNSDDVGNLHDEDYLPYIKESITADKKENINTTPVKSKLRKRPTKKLTEEEVIKYYTDKTIKTKQNTLETIFETPKSLPMSVKRYKRFINFSDRMSGVKVKKRHNKVVKYDLWQNTDPVSMDYFVRKLEEVEEGL